MSDIIVGAIKFVEHMSLSLRAARTNEWLTMPTQAAAAAGAGAACFLLLRGANPSSAHGSTGE